MSRFGCIAAAVPDISPLLPAALSKYVEPLLRTLGPHPEILNRITQFYIPVFTYLEYQLRKSGIAPGSVPIIGISAPQGCGKTTLTDSLRTVFELSGASCVSLSLDDFYLTGEDQDRLASSRPRNELWQCRGNAGTHDLALLMGTLHKLKTAATDECVMVPRYDKSQRAGRGDRAPVEAWTAVAGRPDVVLLEGWMLGFHPMRGSETAGLGDVFHKFPSLKEIDESMQGYQEVHHLVDSWVVLAVDDPQWVFEWRLQAEVAMREAGRPGMTDEQVHDFVSRYMPAYEAYLPQLYRDGPDRRSGAVNAIKVPYAGNQCGYFVFDFNGLTQIRVDSKRNPVEARMYV